MFMFYVYVYVCVYVYVYVYVCVCVYVRVYVFCFFVNESGLLVLSRPIILHVIQKRYFQNESKALQCASLLIDYFTKRASLEAKESRCVSQRTIHELLFFLMATARKEELKTVLSDFSFFEKMVTGENSFDMRIYWNYLGWKPDIVGKGFSFLSNQTNKKTKNKKTKNKKTNKKKKHLWSQLTIFKRFHLQKWTT